MYDAMKNKPHNIDRDGFRINFKSYIHRAFKLLPYIDEPDILDIGCGSGIPTLELAQLTNGQIIGIDINQPELEKLNNKIMRLGLSDRIATINCSMTKMNFPYKSFDVIWAEGSITMIGFVEGLVECRRFLKSIGYLVVHDEISDIKNKIEQVSKCGYKLLNHFILTEEIWWKEYYSQLEKEINDYYLKENRKLQGGNLKIFQEIEMFKKNPQKFSSAYYIMQKT